MHPHRGSAGFTLIELMAVLVLVAIGTVASVPMITKYREAQRLRGAAMKVQQVMNMAKSRAVAMNQVLRVDFAPGSLTSAGGFFTIYVDQDRDSTIDPGEIEAAGLLDPVKRSGLLGYELAKGMYFKGPAGTSTGPYGTATTADGVAFPEDAFSVFPDGTISETGHVTIGDRTDRVYAVAMTIGGAARVFAFDGTAWK